MTKRFLTALTASTMLLAGAGAASAEFQFSGYGGWQTSPHSLVTISDGTSYTAGFDGNSFDPPPYWGIRATYWLPQMPKWGVSIDYAHAKVYADEETFRTDLTPIGVSRFEFTDGLNIVTLNAVRRFQRFHRFEPYAGVGVGLSIPHVEYYRPCGGIIGNPECQTFNYQFGGAAFQAQIGTNFYLTDRFSLFGEYKINYTMNDVDIDSGDTLKTDIVTNAFIFGGSVHF